MGAISMKEWITVLVFGTLLLMVLFLLAAKFWIEIIKFIS